MAQDLTRSDWQALEEPAPEPPALVDAGGAGEQAPAPDPAPTPADPSPAPGRIRINQSATFETAKPGEMFSTVNERGEWSHFILSCPRCGGYATLGQHSITINPAGAVTVQPSIGCPYCGAHFFVRESAIDWQPDIAPSLKK